MPLDPGALTLLFDSLVYPVEPEPLNYPKHTKEETSKTLLSEPTGPIQLTQAPVEPVKKLSMVFNGALSADTAEFVAKVIASVKLGSEDTEYLYVESNSHVPDLSGKKCVLLWGVPLETAEKYTLITQNQTRILLCDDPQDLIRDQELKRKLWAALKQLFHVS